MDSVDCRRMKASLCLGHFSRAMIRLEKQLASDSRQRGKKIFNTNYKNMKYTTITTLAALLLGTAGAFAQSTAYTKPSGFETLTISPGFNMIGLRLLKPIALSGTFGTPSGTDLPTNSADLAVALGASDANSLVIIEVTEGDNAGLTIESTQWSGSNFTGLEGLMANLDGDSFQVRVASTLTDLFGADNTAGFEEGTLQTADIVWVSKGGGAFDKYYYSPGDPGAFPVPVTEGWKNSLGDDASMARFNYIDGLFIQRRGAGDLPLVMTGSVKTKKVSLDVQGNSFNFYSGIFPVSTTLSDSKLSEVLQHGNLTTGDVIWMPNGPGAWEKFTYADADPGAFPVPVTEGWKDAVGADASTQVISSGFIIQRRGSGLNVPFSPNALYDNL